MDARMRVAIERETDRFAETYTWLEGHMPSSFFAEMNQDDLILITHHLMGLHLQDNLARIHLKSYALVLALDEPEADIRVLSYYGNHGIKHYRTYLADAPPPIPGARSSLRLSAIYFTEAIETIKQPIPSEDLREVKRLVLDQIPGFSAEEFEGLIGSINTRFFRPTSPETVALALQLFSRAKGCDNCQYEVRRNEKWKEEGIPSLQIVLAWRNTPKRDLLYRVAKLVYRHGCVMRQVNATYIDPYSNKSVMLLILGLHGRGGEACWDACDISDLISELVTLKTFELSHQIEKTFVAPGLARGHLGNLLETMGYFIHQVLVNVDANLYTIDSINEALCRHPELTLMLCEGFELKFHPERANQEECRRQLEALLLLIKRLDTGQQLNDSRRKNVLSQGVNFVSHLLKTNFYKENKIALAFRLDPHYLDAVPFDRALRFPELPFAVFFIRGHHFIGFHLRFRDLARGGLRTVMPSLREVAVLELGHVFAECYNLAYTQQKKNKDIPEGGAKGVIFIEPSDELYLEARLLAGELESSGFKEDEVSAKISGYLKEQKEETLFYAQRSYVTELLTLINCTPDGRLKASRIVDYYCRPEYLYLGPDERLYDPMIEWIAAESLQQGYKPGIAFISSKPGSGINHKEYGVTSLGVNVYMHELLLYMGIDPKVQPFSIKMSGGPDGDVAGNQICNLHRYYRTTAKLVALTDVSGTINDPEGLDLEEMLKLFYTGRSISFYPPALLHEGGYLLDRGMTRDEGSYVQKTLCWQKKGGELIQVWLSGSEAARLFHLNVHETKADLFIPAGGRPRSLNEGNLKEFLDEMGRPTAKGIVEGANLYLTQEARSALERLGVLIIKDSSANKCGVICSSFEVLAGLILSEAELIAQKGRLVEEILEILRSRAYDEARLLLKIHKETGLYLTDISEAISRRINLFMDELLDHLSKRELPRDPEDPLIRCFLSYCPPLLRNHYRERCLKEVPDSHKIAIIASSVAAGVVYHKGLSWSPNLVDVLPVLWNDPDLAQVLLLSEEAEPS